MSAVTRDTAKGEVFTSRPKKVGWERIWAFSGGPFKAEGWPVKNIHTDLEFAIACGLPSKVAVSATQFQGYMVQLMIDMFGVEWLSLGTIDVKFINAVDSEDTLIAKALITSKEMKNDTTRFTMDISCENQKSEKVLIGTATGSIGEIGSTGMVEYERRLAGLRDICTTLTVADNLQLEPLEYTVTHELNQQFLFAEEDFHSRYIDGTGSSPPIVHPALILNWSNNTRSPSYTAPSLQSRQTMWATFHTRDETFFYNPARVGTKIKVVWTPIGSYERRNRYYNTSEILVTDGDGQEIIRRLYYTTTVSQEYQVKG